MPVWNEPVRGGLPDPSFYGLPGIEQARALMRGLVPYPPMGRLVGHRMTQVGPASSTVTVSASPWLQHSDGTLDLKATIQGALHCAVLSGAPPATEVRTATLSVNHLRPCTLESGSIITRARVVHTGPTFTLVEAIIEDAMGRAVADANAAFLLRPMDPPPPPGAIPAGPVDEPSYSNPDPYLRPLPAGLAPLPGAVFNELDVITIVGKIIAGELPDAPVTHLFGIRYADVGEGHLLLALRTSGWLCDFSSDISPGAIATVAHLALSGVVGTVAPPGRNRVGVVEQSISFFRTAPMDGQELLARGRVIHDDGDLVASSVEITDVDGHRVALGHQTSVLTEQRRRKGSTEELPERILATVLFTDIVGSTEQAQKLGDAAWRNLLDAHHDVVRRQLQAFKGREVKTTGDGFLATFASPGQAVQCARAVRDGVRSLGLQIRAGVHTGECEIVGDDVAGIAVHIASRVQSAAEAGEILVSSTVREVVAGSGLRFSARQAQPLKGLEEDWRLFAVED